LTLFKEQQDEIASLRHEVATCCTELVVLRECLFAEGLLRPSLLQLWACKHQTATQQQASFNEMLQVEDVASMLAALAGPVALQAAAHASSTMRGFAGRAWSTVKDLRQWCVYLCGGSQSLNGQLPERFFPAIGTWEPLPQMQENRVHGIAAVVGGMCYVCGGTSSRGVLNTVERFNPVAVSWSSAPSMHVARQRLCGGAVAGRIFACGGFNDGDTSALNAVECFDPAAAAWEVVRPMGQLRASAAAGVLGGCLYVCGGVRNELVGGDLGGAGELRSVECLETIAQTWHVMPPMFAQRASAAAAVLDGRMYVCGGVSGMEILSSVECFDPIEGCWKVEPWMLMGRFCAMAASVGGHIFVFGGQSGARFSNSVESSIEQLDPRQRSWISLSPMQERRSRAMAAVALE